MTQAPTLETHKPTRIARIATVVLVLFSGCMWWQILRVLALAPQSFERAFDRFDTPGGMATPTQALINLSHVIAGGWPLFAAVVVLAMAGLIWLGMRRDYVGRLALLALVSFLAACAMLPLVLFGLFLPFLRLLQSISGRG
jgi:hypothetical protein